MKGRRKLIELLIEKGSIVNVVENRWKYTPLHLIASMDTSSLDDYHWTEDDQLSNVFLPQKDIYILTVISNKITIYGKFYFTQ